MAVDSYHKYLNEAETANYDYDDFKLIKKKLWSPSFIQHYTRRLKG